MRRSLTALALVALAPGCGDNIPPPAPPELLDALRALPNVADATETPTQTSGYHYIVLHFRQPVDHQNPGGPTFLQEVSLLHRDTAAPLIVWTSGYWDYYLDQTVELTRLLRANQISIEHRYFGDSRPQPPDWSKLTIDQMAADEHEIVSALRTIYTGAAISSGGSKGGMTAVFYRRYYPDDVDGTVPYVAPISFGAPDPRYSAFVASVGSPECHQAVRDVAVELLAHRRAAIEAATIAQSTTHGYRYTRVQVGPAVESAIVSLEWSFWQYFGIEVCPNVPPTTASDTAMFSFLDAISEVHDSDDDEIAAFEAYYYQSDWQLGWPDDDTESYLQTYEMYGDADYAGALPTTATPPTYDAGAAMQDIDQFVEQSGNRLLFVYGQWDPWTGGKFALGNAQDSLELVQPQGTHGSHITQLSSNDEQAALASLAAWTGVTPIGAMRAELAEPRTPHVPPAMMRAMRRAKP